MDIDVEILKTLESIEDLLKGASVLAGGKLSPSQTKSQQSQKQRADKEVTKGFRAIATASGELKDTLLGLNKSLTGLSAEVGRTESGFGSLNAQLNRFADSLRPIDQPTPTTTGGPTFVALQSQVDSLSSRFNGLGTSMGVFQTKLDSVSFAGLTQSANAASHPLNNLANSLHNGAEQMPRNNQVASDLMQNLQNLGGQTQNVNRGIQRMNLPWQTVMNRMMTKFNGAAVGAGAMSTAIESFAEVVKKLTVDFFSLSRVGMGSYSNLFELSKNALKAGMSLKEYSAMLKENISFAARAGSLENFDKVTSAADQQLRTMGIFGDEARALQAKLANSNTMMGVSQDKLTGTISSQISVFDQLRKSTNMTADEFADLVKTMSHSEQSQKELIGTHGAERLARQRELIQINTTGQRLGLAADESSKLAEALMKARGDTVKSRLEQAGRIRQMSAFAGMGGQGERAAQLYMKGRNRTSAEEEEMRQIAGSLDAMTQTMYDQGTFGTQNVIDVLGGELGNGGFGQLMQANRPAQLAEESGKVNQQAFGKHVDKFGQWVGQLIAWSHGFSESIMPSLLTGIGATLLTVFRGPISKVLTSAITRLTGIGGATAAVEAGAGAAAGTTAVAEAAAGGVETASALTKAVGAMKGAVNWLTGVPGMMRNAYNAVVLSSELSGPLNTVKFIFQEMGSSIAGGAQAGAAAVKSGGQAILGGLKAFAEGFAPAAMIIDGVMEAFTGKISEVMDPNGGIWGRIVGVTVAALEAVPGFIIDALSFVFGDNLMKPVQSIFDVIKTGVAGAINGFFRVTLGLVSYLTDLLPADSGLRKMIDAAKEGLDKSLENNANTINELGGFLGENGRKTMAEIAQQNEKTAKSTDDSTKVVAAAQQKFNNVQYGAAVTQAQAVQDAKTLVGTPQVQQLSSVTPGTVNTPEASGPAQTRVDPAMEAVGKLTASNAELATLLNSILTVLQQSLTEEQKQAVLAQQLLEKSSTRTVAFTPAEFIASKLLQQGLI